MKLAYLLLFSALGLSAQTQNASAVTPAWGTIRSGTFSISIPDPGYNVGTDFYSLTFIIEPYGPVANRQNVCMVTYNNTIYWNGTQSWSATLWDDTGTAAVTYGAEGFDYTGNAGNSQCSMAAGWSHSIANNVLTITLPITFTGLQGPLAIYTNVNSVHGSDSGWESFFGLTAGSAQLAQLVTPYPGSRIAAPGNLAFTFTPSTYVPGLCLGTQGVGSCDLFSSSWFPSGSDMSPFPDSSYGGGLAQVFVRVINQVSQTSQQNFDYVILPAPGSFTVTTNLPSLPLGLYPDDFSGQMKMMPTSDNPTIPEAFLTQPANTEIIPVGGSYTAIVQNAPANSPVWAQQSPIDPDYFNPNWVPGVVDPDANHWCPNNPYYPQGSSIGFTGACQVGTTDGTGYFSLTVTGYNPPALGGVSTKFWVGPQSISFNGPPALTTAVDNSTYAGSIYFFVQDSTGEPTYTTDVAGKRPAHLADGKTVAVIRSPRVKLSKASRSSWVQGGDGLYTYSFTLDTSDESGMMVRVGKRLEMSGEHLTELSVQNGWLGTGVGWIAGPEAERSTESAFSLSSTWKPGPVQLYFHGAPNRIGGQRSSAENVAISRRASIFRDSTTDITIGPAIKPGISEADLRLLVREWKDTLGLAFLAPLLASDDWAAGLASLKPSTELERETVKCLRNAF